MYPIWHYHYQRQRGVSRYSNSFPETYGVGIADWPGNLLKVEEFLEATGQDKAVREITDVNHYHHIYVARLLSRNFC